MNQQPQHPQQVAHHEDDDAVIAEAMSYISGGGGGGSPPSQEPQQQQPVVPVPQAVVPAPAPVVVPAPHGFGMMSSKNSLMFPNTTAAVSSTSGLLPDTIFADAKLAIVVLISYIAISVCPVSEMLDNLLPHSVFAIPFADVLFKGLILGVFVAVVYRLIVAEAA